MGFETASEKYSRYTLLIFGSIITGFLFIAPGFLDAEAAARVEVGRPTWLPLYTMIVIYFFKKRTDAGIK